jgi:8-oxo-dGTP diphosphatase
MNSLKPKAHTEQVQGETRRVWQAAEAHSAAPDSKLSQEGPARALDLNRALVKVAVGVLIQADQHILMTTRPMGKVYAGYWEFPGGKIEEGESLGDALKRELMEELGISVMDFKPWKVECVDYPHALVELHFCRVLAWDGELQMREGQRFAWTKLPVTLEPILPGAIPILEWLEQESNTST